MSVSPSADRSALLRKLYFVRAAFSFIWVGLAFTVARQSPTWAAVLLVAYPAWDALANLVDVRSSGGAMANRTQVVNVVVSAIVTAAVAVALAAGQPILLLVFGAWAILSGLLQLATAIRRRKGNRGQWLMMLSGAQSALAGGFFITQQGSAAPVTSTVAGYAAVGALYFLISGLVMLWRKGEAASGARVST